MFPYSTHNIQINIKQNNVKIMEDKQRSALKTHYTRLIERSCMLFTINIHTDSLRPAHNG